MADVLKDRWEAAAALHVPNIAWGWSRGGGGIPRGVLLPWPVEGQFFNKPYGEVFDMEDRTMIGPNGKEVENPNWGQPKRWPPRGGNSIGEAKQNTVFMLAIPDFNSTQLMSDAAIESFVAASKEGDEGDLVFLGKVKKWGLRRLFVTGGSLQPQMDGRIRATTRKPVLGARVSVWTEKLEPRVGGGFTRIFGVEYAGPDTDSLALVNAYMKDPVFIDAPVTPQPTTQPVAQAATQPVAQQQQSSPWDPPRNAQPAMNTVPPSADDEPPF